MSKSVFRAMTPLEARAARALGNASFAPATSAKRIAMKIASQVVVDTAQDDALKGRITDKQAAVMWRLCWSYRKSITDEAVLDHATAVHSGQKKLDVAKALEATLPPYRRTSDMIRPDLVPDEYK